MENGVEGTAPCILNLRCFTTRSLYPPCPLGRGPGGPQSRPRLFEGNEILCPWRESVILRQSSHYTNYTWFRIFYWQLSYSVLSVCCLVSGSINISGYTRSKGGIIRPVCSEPEKCKEEIGTYRQMPEATEKNHGNGLVGRSMALRHAFGFFRTWCKRFTYITPIVINCRLYSHKYICIHMLTDHILLNIK